jgi:hypothetical protein
MTFVFPKGGSRRLLRSAGALTLAGVIMATGLSGLVAASTSPAFPVPSVSPVAWEIDLKYRHPRRVVVDTPAGAKAYWYLVYTVTNNSDSELFFVPAIELLTEDGRVLPANRNIPRAAFEAIASRTRSLDLTMPQDMSAKLLVGEDQAKSSVAIWEEPSAEMGVFDIFFGGLSGEVVVLKDSQGNALKDADGNPIRVRKTRQLRYKVRGDEVRPEEDEVVPVLDTWIMR